MSPSRPTCPSRPMRRCPRASIGDTDSVKVLAAQLDELPPARARYVAAFAYVLGRAANATGAMSDVERARCPRSRSRRPRPRARAAHRRHRGILAGEFGATEDFLVAREFKAISTMEEREQLLRCCFLVMAADDEIDATESWLANRLAEELDVERPDLNAIRDEFHEQLSSVREVRRLAAS